MYLLCHVSEQHIIKNISCFIHNIHNITNISYFRIVVIAKIKTKAFRNGVTFTIQYF